MKLRRAMRANSLARMWRGDTHVGIWWGNQKGGDSWEGNIKTDLKEIGLDGVDWINVAQNEEIYRAAVNTLINHQRRVFRS
jgi:hypothetical protein